MADVTVEELLMLLGEKDVVIYQLKKAAKELNKKIEDLSKAAQDKA